MVVVCAFVLEPCVCMLLKWLNKRMVNKKYIGGSGLF